MISILDLKNGYWLSGLDEKSKELTAFSCEFGTFEYNVAPQGLVCSVAHFQSWKPIKQNYVSMEYCSSTTILNRLRSPSLHKKIPTLMILIGPLR